MGGAGEVKNEGATTLDNGPSLSAESVLETANVTLSAGVSLSNAASNVSTMTEAAGKVIELGGPAAASFANQGSFVANGAGTAEVSPGFVNSGLVTANSRTLAFLGSVSNSGTVDASAGLVSMKTTVAGAGSGQMVDFVAGTGLLDLTKPLNFAGTITGFGGTDQVDLLNTKETSFSYSNNLLTMKDGKATVASLNFTGASNSFSLASDQHGGTLITFG